MNSGVGRRRAGIDPIAGSGSSGANALVGIAQPNSQTKPKFSSATDVGELGLYSPWRADGSQIVRFRARLCTKFVGVARAQDPQLAEAVLSFAKFWGSENERMAWMVASVELARYVVDKAWEYFEFGVEGGA